jgi:sulfite exporter TauE/SafE
MARNGFKRNAKYPIYMPMRAFQQKIPPRINLGCVWGVLPCILMAQYNTKSIVNKKSKGDDIGSQH